MGDRCYMEVKCLRKDKHLFEELGFTDQEVYTDDCEVVELVDEEANYGHNGCMPDGVPFMASGGPGGTYGEFAYVSDGKTMHEVELNGGNPVVLWSSSKEAPSAASVKAVKAYRKMQKQVHAMFDKLIKKCQKPSSP